MNTGTTVKSNYLFDLTDRELQVNYFKMKNKHDFSFTDAEKLKFNDDIMIRIKLGGYIDNIDTILIPETSNILFTDLVFSLGKDVVILKKRTISELKFCLDYNFMQKSERHKLYASMDSMDSIKLANIAGNHRKYFIDILFYIPLNIKPNVGGNCLFMDDSLFSGVTYQAAANVISPLVLDSLFLFSKQTTKEHTCI